MALPSNRPPVERLERRLAGLPDSQLAAVDPVTLAEMLDVCIGEIEEKTNTLFDGIAWTELYDGNGQNALMLRRQPVTSVQLVQVSLPVLALNRTYQPDEIKLYRDEGYLSIFTYKLQAEQASLHLDQQINGNIFPSLPQCVTITHTWGFARYDPDLDITSYDGGTVVNGTPDQKGATVLAGDQRTPAEKRWLQRLQEAATLDAAASYLAQVAAQGGGLFTAVSFDGFSQSLSGNPYATAIENMITRRDELLNYRRRGYWTSTAGA